jgi:hypothetical protein
MRAHDQHISLPIYPSLGYAAVCTLYGGLSVLPHTATLEKMPRTASAASLRRSHGHELPLQNTAVIIKAAVAGEVTKKSQGPSSSRALRLPKAL